MYLALNLLSLFFLALGVSYTLFFAYMRLVEKEADWRAVVFVGVLFFISFIFRVLWKMATRQARIEAKLDRLTRAQGEHELRT